MKKIFISFAFILSFLVIAQTSPSIEWQKSFGGSSNDYAYSIQQATDGYITVGRSASNDGDVSGHYGTTSYHDAWIVKLNNNGGIQWQKSIGGSNYDEAWSVQRTTDGGYIIAGDSASNDGNVTVNHGSYDYWVVKLDNNGNIQWQKSFGGSSVDIAYSVQQTTDGGYIVAGNSFSNDGDVIGHHGTTAYGDFWILKLNSSGNIQWQKTLGGSHYDQATSIQQTTDAGYIIAGSSWSTDGDVTNNHGSWDYWVVKLDSSGNLQWQKSLGGSDYDNAQSVQQTTDGGYIIAGQSRSTDGDISGHHGGSDNFDAWIVKLNGNGNLQWQKSLGGSRDDGVVIRQTTDGGYIAAGASKSNDGDVSGHYGTSNYYDIWVVKLSANGIIQWQKSIGGSNDDGAYSILQTTDNGYVIAGYSASNDNDATGNHGVYDYWVVKLTAEGLATQEIQNTKINFYPNPVKDIITFSEEVSNVKITDLSGKMVKQVSAKGKTLDISALSKGVYIITATTKQSIFNQKIIKE